MEEVAVIVLRAGKYKKSCHEGQDFLLCSKIIYIATTYASISLILVTSSPLVIGTPIIL
ncbi:hypothetical protein CLV51_101192 [Chitinophaga niastensis]|uniref:Uncharacterized protein n=1 Tax=Chitinophaga niastensis TaxID=536980 RepID=A0A2P8HRQ2_CHINA|nr:hypothetical protein CLV51_101192 [Chitinophaga niastensis]